MFSSLVSGLLHSVSAAYSLYSSLQVTRSHSSNPNQLHHLEQNHSLPHAREHDKPSVQSTHVLSKRLNLLNNHLLEITSRLEKGNDTCLACGLISRHSPTLASSKSTPVEDKNTSDKSDHPNNSKKCKGFGVCKSFQFFVLSIFE